VLGPKKVVVKKKAEPEKKTEAVAK
jgi:hypothetical protein